MDGKKSQDVEADILEVIFGPYSKRNINMECKYILTNKMESVAFEIVLILFLEELLTF